MKRAVVFSAAPINAALQPDVPEADCYICADGGIKLANSLGISPDWIVGDFDSLGYMPEGENVDSYTAEKDDTDTGLAAQYALSIGCTEIIFYGALGGRLDHTIANFQTLRMLARHHVRGIFVDEKHWITLQQAGTVRYPKREGYFSLFAMTEQCTGVTLEGVKYPLQNGILKNTFPLGVSNQIIADFAIVTIADGELLVIYARD